MGEHLRSRNRILSLVLLAALGVSACSGRVSKALPLPTKPPTPHVATLGYDISYPQCNVPLPNTAEFAIVGLNGGLANNYNNCFSAEMNWARKTVSSGRADVYVLTADPGPQVADWPDSGNTPRGTCAGGNTLACAYEYGRERASADMQHLNSAVPGYKGTVYLDVEQEFSWQDPAHNRAVLEGMTSEFETAGQKVGMYTLPGQWSKIVGEVPSSSPLESLPVWISGAQSVEEARKSCLGNGFRVGHIIMAQIPATVSGAIDQDIRCGDVTAG